MFRIVICLDFFGATAAIAAMTNKADTSAGMTCAIEEKAKSMVEFMIWKQHKMRMPTDRFEIPQHSKYKTQASVIRSVFHDAQDHNSLKLKSIAGQTIDPVDSSKFGEYGGVDGCLYVPLPNWNLRSWIHKKEMNFGVDFITLHNDNDALVARTAGKFAVESCEILCCTDALLTTEEKHTLCGPELSICKPKTPHPWDTWHVKKQEHKWTHSMEHLLKDKCVVDMHVLGALLITKKADGPQIEMTWGRRQADCTKLFAASNVSKEFKPFPIWLNNAPLNSFEHPHRFAEEFTRMGFSEREMTALMGAHSFGKLHKYAGDFAPRANHSGFCNSSRKKWGDGGYWDRTPDKLDNAYFRHLDTVDPAEKEVCCANHNKYGCRTSTSKSGKPMQFWNGSLVPGNGCKHQWCMRSATPWNPRNKDEANWAMLTTQETMPQWNEKKYGKAPPVRRYMLAGDLALLEDSKARAAVKEFAKSEEAFHSAYKQAFDKAIKLGYPSASLNTCSGPRPSGAELLHAGEGCWRACGSKSGFCDWCGSGHACCRRGWGSDPIECKWATNWSKNMQDKHHCVKTFATKGAMKTDSKLIRKAPSVASNNEGVMSTDNGLLHHGEECLGHCNKKSGYCAWCGSKGACCGSRWGEPPECARALGFIATYQRHCVLVP